MNGPATDSLEIRHTPGTVPGGARPGWGLPFQQLPVATRRNLTPESVLEQEIQTGRRQIQNKYALQWKEVNRSKRFIGVAKSQRMLREIDAKAKQEMLQFNQQAQQQLAQLQNIDRLAEQGLIGNADEIKARMAFGADVAKSMYPETRSIEQRFGTLDIYAYRIDDRLAQFRTVEKRVPALFRRAGVVGWPLPKEKMEPKMQVYDRTIPVKDKEGEITMGDWRPATEQEIAEHQLLQEEKKRITQQRKELLGMPDISRRIVQPDTRGGTFADKIGESIRPQRQRTARPKLSDPLGLR